MAVCRVSLSTDFHCIEARNFHCLSFISNVYVLFLYAANLDCAAAAAKRQKIESTSGQKQQQQQQQSESPSSKLPPLPPSPVGMGRSGIVLLHMRCATKIKVWQNRKASVKLLTPSSQGGLMKYMNLERERRISEEVKRQVRSEVMALALIVHESRHVEPFIGLFFASKEQSSRRIPQRRAVCYSRDDLKKQPMGRLET